MAKPLRWSQLTTGILATAGVVVAAVGVLTFGRVGTLHGKTINLYVTTDAARGVIRGTEVWLDGQKVGLVRDIEFRSPEAPPRERVVIALKVLKSASPHIRVDTRVQVRSGATVIGDMVVYMNSGTAKMREVANGDTIHSREQVDYESIGGDAADAGKELPAIFENVKLLTAQLRETQSALAALGISGPEMTRLRTRSSKLLARLSESQGTLSRTMESADFFRARATRAMAQADSVRALLGSGAHSLGRFRRDSSIVREVTRIRDDISELQRMAADTNGSLGRFRADSAITRAMHRDMAALDSLIADMKKHPLRYNPF